jgi:hypothetical protein
LRRLKLAIATFAAKNHFSFSPQLAADYLFFYLLPILIALLTLIRFLYYFLQNPLQRKKKQKKKKTDKQTNKQTNKQTSKQTPLALQATLQPTKLFRFSFDVELLFSSPYHRNGISIFFFFFNFFR